MRVYLATPYTHDDPKVRHKRFLEINKIAAQLMNQGFIVYSPISASHQISVDHELPFTFDYWEASCEAFIDWCDYLYVYENDGWKESVGVKAEIAYAQKIGKEIRFIKKD